MMEKMFAKKLSNINPGSNPSVNLSHGMFHGLQWDLNLQPDSYASDNLTTRPLTPIEEEHSVIVSVLQ